MNNELYKKMNDDERLQYICNLENVKESLGDVKYIQSEIIDIYKRLVNCNESYAHYEEKRRYAYEKYHNFTDKMLEKYDLYPTPTCDVIPAYTKNGGDLSNE